ncbi:MAG: N-acetylmuramoyl-L-alanine amidase [Acutalibacteraceae bacterium]|nr:N-acetylmuramoyl-L-alanine amidase [Acutalibacteraceae bacterium]
MKKIALDAGHGLFTSGKQTPDGIKEWTLNDAVRKKTAEILSKYDCQIIYTDENEGNTDESLSYRVSKYLNQGVSAVVSIHHNAYKSVWSDATGVEVYTDRNYTEKDDRLAQLIYKKLVKYTGLKGRGVKRADFQVINQNKIPAVLVEGGFMDGKNDYKFITDSEGQQAYALAVAEGLIEFLDLKETDKENLVLLWQQAAINDGFTFEKYGADGIWGSECEEVARKILIKKGSKYTSLNRFFQKRLYDLGYDMSASLKKDGSFDGIWGNGSVQAVFDFQSKNYLSKDKIIGINTTKKLLQV